VKLSDRWKSRAPSAPGLLRLTLAMTVTPRQIDPCANRSLDGA
jgi:hypothetical protein